MAIITNKGEQIMEGLLLNQYQNSPNLKEFMMAFIGEMDDLFEQLDTVYLGRLINDAAGAQLDVIGRILQQSRSVILPQIWFGFVGAPNAEGFADEATPADGGVFKSEDSSGYEVTPLIDSVYRRVLLARAEVLNSDTCSVDSAYKVVSIILGRVPATFKFTDLGSRAVELELSDAHTTDDERVLIIYMAKHFIPVGVTFTINLI